MIKSLLKTSATTLSLTAMVLVPAATLTAFSATPAFAGKGNGNGNGNGGGNGNGNSRAERADTSSNGRGNGNGRGAIASELKSLNAANASQTALENASPNSMPGKLYTYQQAQIAANAVDDKVEETGDLYAALQNMTEARFNELNPDLDYQSTLAATAADYQAALDAQATAETTSDDALAVLTGGRTLSNAAMNELQAMLGL